VVRQAKAMPGKLNGILRLHFCVWTDAEEAWMSRKALEAVLADFDPAKHQGKPVDVGIDLSGTQDLTAMAFVVETGTKELQRDDGATVTLPTYDAWIEAWMPGDTIKQRAEADRSPYDLWHDQGFLHAPPGKHIRLDFVAARLAEVTTEYQPALVAYDRYAFRKFEEECEALGLTLNFVEHPQGGKRRAKPPDEAVELAKAFGQDPPQGLWMPGSVRELENLVLDQRIRLKRNPVLIRACMSAACEADPFDNRWFVKAKSMNRIDALVALTMAVGAATSGIDLGAATIPEDYEVRVWG
jgi:phage terminase large subunit-like protein